jgi:hypothetical protein
MAIGFAIFSYYTVLFAAKLVAETGYTVEPSGKISITKFISSQNASQGTFIIVMQQGLGGQNQHQQPFLQIANPSGKTLVEKQLAEALTMDTFPVTETGNYTLTLANTPSGSSLKANVIFGDQRTIIESGLSVSPDTLSLIFNLTLYTAITIIIAGAIITFLDRKRINKMKQFGDTSDLV